MKSQRLENSKCPDCQTQLTLPEMKNTGPSEGLIAPSDLGEIHKGKTCSIERPLSTYNSAFPSLPPAFLIPLQSQNR